MILFSESIQAQDIRRKIDSLVQELPGKKGLEIVKTQQKIANYYEHLNADTAHFYYRQSIVAARKYDLHDYEANAYINIGGGFFQTGQLDSSAIHITTALELAEKYKNDNSLAGASLIMGNIQLRMQQPDEAFKYYRQGYNLSLKQKDYQNLSRFLFGISLVYGHQGNQDSSLYYLMVASDSLEAHKNWGTLGGVYNNIGKLYSEMGEKDSTIIYLKRA